MNKLKIAIALEPWLVLLYNTVSNGFTWDDYGNEIVIKYKDSRKNDI